MSDEILKIEDLHTKVEGNEILNGLSLEVHPGEIHALMGPNGSGKSTLAYALMGKPNYEISQGHIYFKGEEVSTLTPEDRAKKGLFLGFQYPVAIPGVTVANFLLTALHSLSKGTNGHHQEIRKNFRKILRETLQLLDIDQSFATRYLNDGFSGGEKKRIEILQLLVLQPQFAILDETDSGLDIDALKVVSHGVGQFINKDRGVLLITHYQRILNYLKPHRVHILAKGKIVASGGPEFAEELERKGYKAFEGGYHNASAA